MAVSRIVELSQRIAANTSSVNNKLITISIPEPSFSVNAPLEAIISQDDTEVDKARQEVIKDTLELHQLLLGPKIT